jgi:hypothetical protein
LIEEEAIGLAVRELKQAGYRKCVGCQKLGSWKDGFQNLRLGYPSVNILENYGLEP